MKSSKILQKQLRELREECNIPLSDFAEMLGINRNHLYRLENADDEFSTLTLFDRLPAIIYEILHKNIRLIFRFEDGRIMGLDKASEWINECRKADFQTQAEYSLRMGLSTHTITRFERDQLRSLRTIAQIAEAHGATLEMEIYETD